MGIEFEDEEEAHLLGQENGGMEGEEEGEEGGGTAGKEGGGGGDLIEEVEELFGACGGDELEQELEEELRDQPGMYWGPLLDEEVGPAPTLQASEDCTQVDGPDHEALLRDAW
jgi:hypothetical protein